MELTITYSPAIYIVVFLFGLVLGSFMNVCIYRIPREKSIVYPPSHCTSCSSPIRFYDNIPLLSYLALGGKCRNCGVKISVIYPLVEIITAVLITLLFYKFGISSRTLLYMVITLALIVITFIDIEHMIIPNVITIPGILIGLLYNAAITDWGLTFRVLENLSPVTLTYLIPSIPLLNSIFGIIVGGGSLLLIAYLYKWIRKTEGMGMGDVKLLAMLGAFLGVNGVFFIIFVSSLVGSVVGIAIILLNKGNLKFALPFGPFISLGAILFILTGGFFFLNL